MSELVIRVNLNLGARRPVLNRCLLAAGMLLASVPELASESVTLTTYYPAPSGVYTQMITTGNTFLARDTSTNASQVTIGGTATSTGQQLDVYSYKGSANNAAIRAKYAPGGLGAMEFAAVAHRSGVWTGLYANQGAGSYAAFMNGSTLLNGNTLEQGTLTVNSGPIAGNYGLMPTYQSWAAYGTGSGGAAVYNDGGGYRTLMLVGNNSNNGSTRNVSVWDAFNVNGSEYASSSIVTGAGGSCYFSGYNAGPNVQICAGGYFVTLVGGYMSKYTVINSGPEPAGEALCCPCPQGLVSVGYSNSCPNL